MITGGAGAIGRAIATRLGHDGRAILLVDLDERVEDAAAELGSQGIRCEGLRVDLTREGAGETVAYAVERVGLPLTLLVNNAGITRDGRALKLSQEDYANVVRVNLVAPLRLAVALHPLMSDGGAVVNLSSRAALGNFGQANYVTAKSGLVGITRALAQEWAPSLRVNAVAPGLVDTPMTEAMPPEVLDKLVARVPLRRIGRPEDVAGVVAFLAGPDATYVTGQMLLCCGGRSIAA